MKRRFSTVEETGKPQADVDGFATSKGSGGAGLIYWSAMVIVILMALWLRTDDLISWHKQPHRAFYNSQPLLINFDGYYYLSLARDIRQGTYTRVDELRGVPKSPMRPVVPPILSALTACLDWLAPVSIEWIAVLLPPLLGLSLAIPLALFGRLYGGRFMSLVAVSMGLFPGYYVYRSHLGWYDTDCLNVTLFLLICYFFIRFGLDRQRRRYLFLLAGIATYCLFLLWWDQTPAMVTLISFSPLIVVLALYYRPTGWERWGAICIGLVLLGGIFLWQGTDLVKTLYQKGAGQLAYISKQQRDDFPNVGVSIKEQKKIEVNDLAKRTTGHLFSFALSLAGLAMLAWRFRGKAAALIVPFGIGCFSFLFARRFLIFLNPFLAIGLGFMAQWLWALRKKWPPYRYAVPLFISVALLIPFKDSLRLTFWPKEIPPLVEGMDFLSKSSPKDAVAWAWWDHGYPMLYWAQRATINDGSLHGGLRTVSNAIPIATSDPLLSANFMRFYCAQGIGGMEKLFASVQGGAKGMALIKEVLMSTPDQAEAHISKAGLEPVAKWRQFFFPDTSKPLYLYLDLRLARTTHWWYWFGMWDVENRSGVHPDFQFITNCRLRRDLISGRGFSIDVRQGIVAMKGRSILLKTTYLREGKTWNRVDYAHEEGFILTYDPKTRIATIMDEDFAASVFSQLYIFKQPDTEIFQLAAENYPYYQVWKIRSLAGSVQTENP